MQRDPPVKGHWRLLQACRLIPKKGVSTSIRAFAILQREFPNAELFIAGKGPLQPKLEGLAAQLGISEKVHFCGFLTQKELLKLYATSHLFLHPSETELDQNQEGIPNSVLEAMSTGLAVAATRHGGIPEAVQHGRTGLLVKEGDFVSLAESVAAILRSAQTFREMGWLASESVAVNFEQSEQIRQLESFYDEAIAMTSCRRRGSSIRASAGSGELSRTRSGGIKVVKLSPRRTRKFSESCLVISAKPALVCATQASLVFECVGLCGCAPAKKVGPPPLNQRKMHRYSSLLPLIAALFVAFSLAPMTLRAAEPGASRT